jgi:hypothetical protein
MDRKRRRLLAVKWAKPGIVLRASPLQLDVVADDADDIRLLLDYLFEIFSRHEWCAAVIDTSPFGIVSQWAADGNIPELDCCGEAVGNEFCLLRYEEIDAGLIPQRGQDYEVGDVSTTRYRPSDDTAPLNMTDLHL